MTTTVDLCRLDCAPSGTGILVQHASTVTENTVETSANFGIATGPSGLVRGNTVRGNGDHGIFVPDDCVVADNALLENATLTNMHGIDSRNGVSMPPCRRFLTIPNHWGTCSDARLPPGPP